MSIWTDILDQFSGYTFETGHVHDAFDPRDWLYGNTHGISDTPGAVVTYHGATTSTVPAGPRLPVSPRRPRYGAVLYQGSAKSCTAHAVLKQALAEGMADARSRLEVYYEGRLRDGTVGGDWGLSVRNGAKALAEVGAGTEKTWPYSTSLTKIRTKPPVQEYIEAAASKVGSYSRLMGPSDYVACLDAGHGFCIGFEAHQPFKSTPRSGSKIGQVAMPSGAIIGWHTICVIDHLWVGDQHWFEFINSWGTTFGDSGFGYMPDAYLENPALAADAWTVRI